MHHGSPSKLALGALGVVFGDIGTSPLYSMQEALKGSAMGVMDVLGILSLICWTLILVISIKYLCIVFRADNDGEGGVLALLALLKQKNTKYEYLFYLMAIFGAGLLFGDGMLTPAISVTSAIEGLDIITPTFHSLIIPLSCIILITLFSLQSQGTARIGACFGPILLVWFIVIAFLGVIEIAKHPFVLRAVNPYYAASFLYNHGLTGYKLLGDVFLVVTGGEALYADLGHFGKRPIRQSWFMVVMPALLLNYFGQGSLLLSHPEMVDHPFYHLAHPAMMLPLVILSTAATIIASQAVISATFSLMRQAVLLGFYPKVPIIQTSKEQVGQVYIPQANLFLAVGTIAFVLSFKTASALTHAYGIAVNGYMVMVTMLVTYAALVVWQWHWLKVLAVFSVFLGIDLAFLGANIFKVDTGGWIPLAFAFFVATIMYTWGKGLNYLKNNVYLKYPDISRIIKQLQYDVFSKLEGVTGIFITDIYDTAGGNFLHFLKLSLAVPENILILNYAVENIPHVHYSRRFEVQYLADRVCKMTLHYGFMDQISVPNALDMANAKGILPFVVNVHTATYMVEIPNVIPSKEKKDSNMFYWQEKVFAFLVRNYSANLNIEFYKLPYNRTIAIGTYCLI